MLLFNMCNVFVPLPLLPQARPNGSQPLRVMAGALLGFCVDIAAGMRFLAGTGVVHRVGGKNN